MCVSVGVCTCIGVFVLVTLSGCRYLCRLCKCGTGLSRTGTANRYVYAPTHAYRYTYRHTDRQTCRQTHTHTHTYIQTYILTDICQVEMKEVMLVQLIFAFVVLV